MLKSIACCHDSQQRGSMNAITRSVLLSPTSASHNCSSQGHGRDVRPGMRRTAVSRVPLHRVRGADGEVCSHCRQHEQLL